MKRILLVFLMFCWSVLASTTVFAKCENKCTAGSVPCERLGDYLPQSQLDTDPQREWGPYRGYIYVIGTNTIQVAFRFDKTAIDTFKSNSDFALELDVVDKGEILDVGSWFKTGSFGKISNFPSDVVIVKDTDFGDLEIFGKSKQLSLVILRPHLLKEETTYVVEFYTTKAITKSGHLHLNVGLSVDFVMSGEPNCINALHSITGNWRDPFNYFALENDAFATFQYTPGTVDGVCWINHEGSGKELCSKYFEVSLPSPDPESSTPPPPPTNLPKLVTAGTSSSAPNLSATVVIEKNNKDEDTNQQVPLGDLYCGIQTKNTTGVKIGSFENKCTLYDGLKAGNDSPESLGSKTVSSLDGGKKTTTHHSFTLKDPSYYTLYGCANAGSNPPKETKTSDNCGTRTFLAYGVPDVRVEKVSFQGAGTTGVLGSSIAVITDLGNSGDNFHAGKNRKMTVSAELSGCVPTQTSDALEMSDDILFSGASGKTKTFAVTIPPTATPGICIVTIVADPKGELQQEPNRESNRENNRMAITFTVVEPTPPPENCDLVISSAGLTGDRTTLKQGDSYGYKARLLNTGSVQCSSDTRLSYFEKGPGDTDWRYIDGDSTPASKLLPGQSSDERMLSDTLVARVLGLYQGKICADTDNANMEKDEGNNCFLMSFSVVEGSTDPGTQPPPSGTTDPDDDDVIFSIIFD